jgi:hypothetical protein
MSITWVTFTRRTNDPKLTVLRARLWKAGIRSRLNQITTFHAPICEVLSPDLDKAWAILEPIDDVPDGAPEFFVEYDTAVQVLRPGKPERRHPGMTNRGRPKFLGSWKTKRGPA